MNIETPAKTDLPEGVVQVMIAEGHVLAEVTPALANRGVALRVGTAEARMTPASPAEIDALSGQIALRPVFDPEALFCAATPDDRPPASLCVATVNGMEDWTLAGRKTLQMQFPDLETPCEMQLAEPIRLPGHTQPLVFQAALASHRAVGQLRLRRIGTDETGREVELDSEIFDFDETRMGGAPIEAYHVVRHRLAPAEAGTELRLSVVYKAYLDDGSGLLPFLFLADPHVHRPGRRRSALVLNGKTGGKTGGTVWLGSPLPALAAAGDAVDLLVGETRATLIPGCDPQISLLADHGSSLQVSAGTPGVYHVMIDGKFAFSQSLGRDPVWMRIPVAWQTGQVRRVSIMDEGETRLLLSTHVLMPRILTPPEVLQTESTAPFPGPLMAQAAHRYAALAAQMAAGNDAAGQARIARALSVLEGGHENVRLEPLDFPEHDTPDVSVVIPAHNQINATYLALASLLLAHNHATFEVIVVDDGSTDETAELEKIVSGITVVRNERPRRFLRACNDGAARARGRYLALLNNDVEVTNGWLDALIDGFGRFPDVGLAGAKLLYPDGSLQEAGGIVWGNGNPWNYGNRQNPWEPRFCYARQADYLSGAALMTTKEIWDELGGFSDYLAPMYFEDTDFAFKVREAGYATWYIPSSVVYHFEGMTSGTDLSSGFKRYQEVNRPRFKARWAKAFAGFGEEGENPDLEKDRGIAGRVLFIDNTTPRPDRDAGSHAAIQEIRLVQSLGYKVTFLPRNLAHLGSYTEALEKMGVEVIHAPFFMSLENYLDSHAGDFDAFYITRFYVARDVTERLRELAPDTKILFNNADLHFLRELRAGIVAGDPDQIAAAGETRTQELEVMRRVDVVLSYNEVEHAVIQSHTEGQVCVVKCPWVVELPDTVPGPENRAGLSFLGNYQHAPNAEGVLWFAREVMPRLAPDHPDLKFVIYGSSMTGAIRALESDLIRPAGHVENIADAFDRHRIFVAPLLSGAGLKGKVLAALAHGIPCVMTPVAAEGIGLRNGHDCLIATSPEDWQDAIARLQEDDALWRTLSENARSYVRKSFSFETGRDLMRTAFAQAGLQIPAR